MQIFHIGKQESYDADNGTTRKCPPSCSSKIMVSLAMQILGGHEMIHIHFEVQKSHQDFLFKEFFQWCFLPILRILSFQWCFYSSIRHNSSMKSLFFVVAVRHRSTSTDPAQFLSMSAPQWSIAGAKCCEISWLSWLYWQDGAAKIAN